MSRRGSALLIRFGLAGFSPMMSFPAHGAGNAKRGGQIADTPGMGEMALRVFFQTPHKQMPDFWIADDVRDALFSANRAGPAWQQAPELRAVFVLLANVRGRCKI